MWAVALGSSQFYLPKRVIRCWDRLTPEMVVNAKKLAKEEQVEPTFLVMDAEKLEFEDASFDMVISRNLTWTLPHAEEAYQEWKRVLKPGGILLNFDANYGNDDCSDTSGLPKNHAHYTVGDELLQECEEIKNSFRLVLMLVRHGI